MNKTIKAKVYGSEIKFNIVSEALLKEYLKALPDGAEIEIFISTVSAKASKAQIAKVHANIRQLSNELGYTIDEVKDLVKKKAHLINDEGKLKSFADCTRDELSRAIEETISMGDFTGSNLR